MKNKINVVLKFGVVALTITLMVGCKPISDFFSKKSAPKKTEATRSVVKEKEGRVLLRINEKTAITEPEFDEYIAQILQMNPYLRAASPKSLSMDHKRKLFEELKKQELIIALQDKRNIEKDPEFIDAFNKMIEMVKRTLKLKKFEESVYKGIDVKHSDVKKYFNENKAKFVKDPGGVNVSGIKFTDSEKAHEFFEKSKGTAKKEHFDALTEKHEHGQAKDFGRVAHGEQGFGMSDIPKKIKDKAFKTTGVHKVVDGKHTWVIHSSDKKDPESHDFNEIKDQLEGMLKNNKFRDEVNKQTKDLEGQFTVDVNEEFFAEEKQHPMLPKGAKIKTKEEVEAEMREKAAVAA